MPQLSIAELNKKLTAEKARWVAAENPITLLSPENRRKLLGDNQQDTGPAIALHAAAVPLTTFALEVDWRNYHGGNHVTPVKNQASCGSCVSFCTVGVTEAMASIEHNVILDLSEADQHYCSSHGKSCSGWNHKDALGQIKSRGVCDELAFPYSSAFPNGDPNYYFSNPEDSTHHPACIIAPDRSSRIAKITSVEDLGTNQAAIKQYITNVGPVAASFKVYDDFFSYRSGVYHHVSGEYAGGHCVMVIGYSESAKCWICKNSWGPNWGDHGFFKIGYNECSIDSRPKIGAKGTVLPPVQPLSPFETGRSVLEAYSQSAPAICQFNNRVYLAWIDTTGNRVCIAHSSDGVTFSSKIAVGGASVFPPALAVHNGRLFVGWQDTSVPRRIKFLSSSDGINFSQEVTLIEDTNSGPSLASFNGKLFVAWRSQSLANAINIASSADGRHFSDKIILPYASFGQPAMSVVGQSLYVAWNDQNAPHAINTAHSMDGVTFSGKATLSAASNASVSIGLKPATSPIDAARPPHIVIGWTTAGNHVSFLFPNSSQNETLSELTRSTPALSYPYAAWISGPFNNIVVAKLAL